MRVPAAAGSQGVGINMTPMIDVVFQLIIFFLVSSHLVKQETQLDLPLPAASSGAEDEPADRPLITINVLGDGRLLSAGRELSLPDLEARLRERKSRHGEELEVRIRCDRGVPYGKLQPVMLACTRAGLWNVTYAVIKREETR